jgi:hypothetical protein
MDFSQTMALQTPLAQVPTSDSTTPLVTPMKVSYIVTKDMAVAAYSTQTGTTMMGLGLETGEMALGN